MLTKILLSRSINVLHSNVTRRIGFSATRLCEKIEENNKKSNIAEEYHTIYKFPYIRGLSTINRLKIYQVALTCLSIPASVIGSQMDVISNEAILITTSIGVTGCMVLFSLSYVTQRFVGFVYLNDKGDTAKVSYIDFWGNRKDEIIKVDDIVPISDMQFSVTDGLFLKLCRFSTKEYLKLNVTLGTIIDKEKFTKVFK